MGCNHLNAVLHVSTRRQGIGVNVGAHAPNLVVFEGHLTHDNTSRTSEMLPVTAAAATDQGEAK